MAAVDVNVFLGFGDYKITGIAFDAFFIEPAILPAFIAVSGHFFDMERRDFVLLKIKERYSNIKDPVQQGHDIIKFRAFDIILQHMVFTFYIM